MIPNHRLLKVLPLSVVLVLTELLTCAAYGQTPCQDKSTLPAISGTSVTVTNDDELQNAISNQQANTTILLKEGTYNLSSTLYIRKSGVTIRGDGDSCDRVILMGKGMENASYGNVPHGIWSDALNLTIMNLTIRDVYYHGIILNSGAQSPTIESVQLLNSGQQFIKSNPTQYAIGVDNGVVKHTRIAYTNGAPTTDHGSGIGYTNGVDVHAGKNWTISGNLFENLHTLDSAAWWWNPAILMWNGAENSIVENNLFINVDRAIAFGLIERNGDFDHQGGIIRNNMITYTAGLFSANRKNDSDGAIIVWNSPSSIVANNTILSNANLNKSIEFRFNTTGAQAINNLTDVGIGSRNSGTFANTCNISSAVSTLFKAPAAGNLRLNSTASIAIDKCNPSNFAPSDIDGTTRNTPGKTDAGAHEYTAASPPNPPTNIQAGTI